MILKRQDSFDWQIALYLFLGGTGGGLFLVGFILEQLKFDTSLIKFLEILGPVFVLAGCMFLLFHSGSGIKTKVYLLFLKPGKSSMSTETWVISIYVMGAFIYTFLWNGWVWGWFVAVFSVLMAIYPGFILSENKAIPFWNTLVLPVLLMFSGLGAGLAFLSLGIAFLSLTYETIGTVYDALLWANLLIIIIQLILIWGYLSMSSNHMATFYESLSLLKKPLFIIGTLILGLIAPLFFHVLALMWGKGMSSGMSFLTAILLIIGAISLRFSIIRAGVYLPRHSL